MLVYDGSYWRNQNKNDLMITRGAVYCNAGDKDINDALTEVGTGGVIMLSTGTHSPSAPISVASKSNFGIECVAGILPPSSICEITQAVLLNASSSQVRFAGVQLEAGLSIANASSDVNHNIYSCYINTLVIQGGTPNTGSRFIRFTDCEIENTIINQTSTILYFIRCSFAGTFSNSNTTQGRVIMIDCIVPSPAGTITYAGTSQSGSGASANITQHLGASSIASITTNFVSSAGVSADLVFKDEYGVSKKVLTDFSRLDNLQDVSYPTTLSNGEILYSQGGAWINKKLTYPDISGTLIFSDISGQLATATQLDNSGVTVNNKFVALGGSTTLVFGDISGQLATATQLDNSGITIAGSFVALGESVTLDLQDLTDISFSTTPVAGEYLRSDGTDFRNSALLTSDLCGNYQYIDFNTNPTVTQQEGRIHWDNTDGTLNIGLTNGVELHSGQETYYIARNETASTITKGMVVYASGVYGGTGNSRISVSPAIANGSIQSIRYIGVAKEDILSNSFGKVWDFGYIREINTNTIKPVAETWVAGDLLFSSPTVAGGLTKVMPSAPSLIIPVAIVIVAGNNGTLFIRPTLTNSLAELLDISLNAFANKQVLINNGTEFLNRQLEYADISGNASLITFDASGLISFNQERVRIGGTSTATGGQSSGAIAIGGNAGGYAGAMGQDSIAIGSLSGYSGVAQPANTLIINASGTSLNASGTTRTHIAPIRQDTTQTIQMMYNTSTKEVVYNDRLKDYAVCRVYGNLINYSSANQSRNLFLTIPTTTTYTGTPQESDQTRGLTWEKPSGIIQGLTTSRLYKVDLDVSIWFASVSAGNWTLTLFDNSGNALSTKIYQNTNGDNISLHLTWMVTGQTGVYCALAYSGTATTTDSTTNEVSAHISVTEY